MSQPEHWMPDNASESCVICNKAWSFTNKRHHCRKCGRLVCAACSPHKVLIPLLGHDLCAFLHLFVPVFSLSRFCSCYYSYGFTPLSYDLYLIYPLAGIGWRWCRKKRESLRLLSRWDVSWKGKAHCWTESGSRISLKESSVHKSFSSAVSRPSRCDQGRTCKYTAGTRKSCKGNRTIARRLRSTWAAPVSTSPMTAPIFYFIMSISSLFFGC